MRVKVISVVSKYDGNTNHLWVLLTVLDINNDIPAAASTGTSHRHTGGTGTSQDCLDIGK